MDTIMVTGGRGFTGRHITARLVGAGRSVVSYNRDFDSSEDGVVMVQGELFDVSRLVRALQQHGIREIVHTAAMSHPTLSLEFPIATFAANVDGTVALLEAARLAGVKRVVNFSSEVVYGAVDGPVTEDLPVKPSTPYAVTKVTTEWLGRVYTDRYGLEVVSLRIAQVYGPGDRMPEVLGDMLKALTRTGAFELAEGRDHGFNFIHARDVALATERALSAHGPFALTAYNVSSAEYWRLGEVVELVRPLFPSGRIQIGPGRVAELDMQGPFDGEAARRDLGYEPEWTLERGLADYAEWLKTHEA
jgi:nucleoside-diphosphate-sugar epimerase